MGARERNLMSNITGLKQSQMDISVSLPELNFISILLHLYLMLSTFNIGFK